MVLVVGVRLFALVFSDGSTSVSPFWTYSPVGLGFSYLRAAAVR